eukprot:CAMPEP_0115718692 /NCGR_PEP_ID=MMETSP0272-20121206/77573_1 /TAXON_ID=71861 /ORGANISM="Scrippsiella trochoidea, Strain CCMP3099" /LENGTH=79 /DNA_ID=CAMNT_0003161251 /DNA_START=551 /DNA_END=790 /DNA_ORIENTATION=+
MRQTTLHDEVAVAGGSQQQQVAVEVGYQAAQVLLPGELEEPLDDPTTVLVLGDSCGACKPDLVNDGLQLFRWHLLDRLL